MRTHYCSKSRNGRLKEIIAKLNQILTGYYHYYEYAEVRILEADGFSIMVKGENGIYRLAIWQKGGYSYSLHLERGEEAETFVKIASENQ